MSRAYTIDHRGSRRASVWRWAPVLLAVATVAAQIAYPLASGHLLRAVTIATVVLFFAASVTHAIVHHGLWWAVGFVVITAGAGLGAEALGVRTGYPFGQYAYTDTLGPQLLGVPIVVAAAWTMMAYPAFVLARRLVADTTALAVPIVGGVALSTWDLFLDPQMVAAGHWTWSQPSPSLPGVSGIPLTNYAGWLLVSVAVMTLLELLLPSDHAPIGVPAVLYVWTWAGSVLANLFFFDRPGVALAGGVGMGLVAVPALWSLWNSRP